MSRLIETHSARNPRLLFFHGIVAGLLLLLLGKLTYLQFRQTLFYSDQARMQNQRRVIVPGPRGNIYDREHRALVENRPRLSVVLDLAGLRAEFRAEYTKVKENYSTLALTERPNSDQLVRIARTSVAQRYLDRINFILHRHETVDSDRLKVHIDQSLLLPFVLLDDLAPEEYARLIERLPVNSPLQVYTSSTRHYPHGTTAAHVLGYTGVNINPEVEGFEGDDLRDFKMPGSFGRDGLEKIFDDQLQGETGVSIHLVDHAGYKIPSRDLPNRRPVQGRDIVTSLDLDLQLAAEAAMKDGEGNDRIGAAVAVDVVTGEVLVMVSKPDYDLNMFVPRLSQAYADKIKDSVGWINRAIQGQYPPGSTFKLITAIAGLRAGSIEPATAAVDCPGYLMVGNRRFPCHRPGGHGHESLVTAIRDSCNVFFYKYGLETGPELIAAEAKRFGYNHPTGIELPSEFSHPHVADPEWRSNPANWQRARLPDGIWRGGDTANLAIGQGDTLISPLQAACMVASLARGETETRPTLLHDPNRPPQRSAPIGLSPADYRAVLDGMNQSYRFGTGRLASVEGLDGAAKSGTAQKGRIDLAWLVAFAPLENPRIAVAVVLEGKEDDNSFGGGQYAGPVVQSILEAWKTKRDRPPLTAPKFKVN